MTITKQQKTNNSVKKWSRGLKRRFPKKDVQKWPTSTRNVAQIICCSNHHTSLRRCKSKPQWDTAQWDTSNSSLLAIVQKQTTKKITSVSKDVVNLESLLTLGRNVKWFSLCRNQYDGSYKLKAELPYDTEIPLLGLCPKMNESSL